MADWDGEGFFEGHDGFGHEWPRTAEHLLETGRCRTAALAEEELQQGRDQARHRGPFCLGIGPEPIRAEAIAQDGRAAHIPGLKARHDQSVDVVDGEHHDDPSVGVPAGGPAQGVAIDDQVAGAELNAFGLTGGAAGVHPKRRSLPPAPHAGKAQGGSPYLGERDSRDAGSLAQLVGSGGLRGAVDKDLSPGMVEDERLALGRLVGVQRQVHPPVCPACERHRQSVGGVAGERRDRLARLDSPLGQSGRGSRHPGKPLRPSPLAASPAGVVDLGQVGSVGTVDRRAREELAKRTPFRLPVVDRM